MRIARRLVVPVCLIAAASAFAADTPQKGDVERALKERFEQKADGIHPRAALTLNDVRFGKAYAATAQEVQVDGVPSGASVTPAIVDFTVRSDYDRETQALRRVREARVYRDKMGDWTVVTGSVRGQDTTVVEPRAH